MHHDQWIKIWSKRYSLRLGENWIFSSKAFSNIFGINFPDQLIVMRDGIGTGYVKKEQLDICSREILDRIYGDSFEKLFEERAIPIFEDFLKLIIFLV